MLKANVSPSLTAGFKTPAAKPQHVVEAPKLTLAFQHDRPVQEGASTDFIRALKAS